MVRIEFYRAEDRLLSSVMAEIAKSDEEQMMGLMFRTSLPEYQGMLFPFPYAWRWSFWMKNTLIPLDMLFIDEYYSIVNIYKNVVPGDNRSHYASRPVVYGLELNGGFCVKHLIQDGDRIKIY